MLLYWSIHNVHTIFVKLLLVFPIPSSIKNTFHTSERNFSILNMSFLSSILGKHIHASAREVLISRDK